MEVHIKNGSMRNSADTLPSEANIKGDRYFEKQLFAVSGRFPKCIKQMKKKKIY